MGYHKNETKCKSTPDVSHFHVYKIYNIVWFSYSYVLFGIG